MFKALQKLFGFDSVKAEGLSEISAITDMGTAPSTAIERNLLADASDLNDNSPETGFASDNILAGIQDEWRVGNWENLTQVKFETINNHPERAKLAVLVAAGYLQLGNKTYAQQLIDAASQWHCDRLFLFRILISGVYNTLGKTESLINHNDRALNFFAAALNGIDTDEEPDYRDRINTELKRLGISWRSDVVSETEIHFHNRAVKKPTSKPIVRVIHHFSCTGGTLFSKCLAAQPDTVLLSEIDPFSRLGLSKPQNPTFQPRDIISILHQSDGAFDRELIKDIFCNDIGLILEQLSKTNKCLILREHTHSIYLTGDKARNEVLLDNILSEHYLVKSIVTVRNPIDSYLSLRENKWLHFSPPNFDEYCIRYLNFLRDHANVKTFRYEDFVKQSNKIMFDMCRELSIRFDPGFTDTFSQFKLTGDSGRKGDIISERPRRAYDLNFVNEVNNSANFKEVCKLLSYDDNIALQ
ncbi:hypothetical protein [Methylomonas rhizoryzae]|uniref:hypothetical protein n=1 Tax=Methylomonas rhizoryzae TaxID=2608981 RepID=UPI0012318AEA|nr:hypothetical protein [Methylomonas rhizoryzae]